MNDYPADPPQETINDSNRIYPGDGIAPVKQVLKDLYRSGQTTVLSLELFNPSYWEQDALAVAKKGLEKMKAAAQGID
jgi:sugar phosphate isomerase/epimerase